jgi:hypothetical protein
MEIPGGRTVRSVLSPVVGLQKMTTFPRLPTQKRPSTSKCSPEASMQAIIVLGDPRETDIAFKGDPRRDCASIPARLTY